MNYKFISGVKISKELEVMQRERMMGLTEIYSYYVTIT